MKVRRVKPTLFDGFGGMVRTSHWWCGRCGYHRHHATHTITPR